MPSHITWSRPSNGMNFQALHHSKQQTSCMNTKTCSHEHKTTIIQDLLQTILANQTCQSWPYIRHCTQHACIRPCSKPLIFKYTKAIAAMTSEHAAVETKYKPDACNMRTIEPVAVQTLPSSWNIQQQQIPINTTKKTHQFTTITSIQRNLVLCVFSDKSSSSSSSFVRVVLTGM